MNSYKNLQNIFIDMGSYSIKVYNEGYELVEEIYVDTLSNIAIKKDRNTSNLSKIVSNLNKKTKISILINDDNEKDYFIDIFSILGIRKLSFINRFIFYGDKYEIVNRSNITFIIIDTGLNHTTLGVVKDNNNVSSYDFKIAGENLNESIKAFIKKEFKMELSDESTEEAKKEIGNANLGKIEEEYVVTAKNLKTETIDKFVITSRMITAAIKNDLEELSKELKFQINQLPVVTYQEIIKHGIILVGGNAKLKGLEEYLTRSLGVLVFRV